MKKILLGTSAIVALTALSTEAFAADKIALGLGGFHKQYVNYSNHDEAADGSMKIGQQADSEIYVNGSTTLDNGIDVGVRTEIETNGEDAGNSTDRVFLTVGSDAMGTVRLGVAAHMMDDYAVRAPQVGPADWGDHTAWTNDDGAAAANSSVDLANFGDNSIKMGYHTPTFSGFTGYASYGVAEGSGANNGRALTRSTTHDSGTMGVAWEGEFSGATIGADVGYIAARSNDSHGTASPILDGFDATRGGLSVGMAGFTVGGSYSNIDADVTATTANDDFSGDAWELGVGYETGPYSVAAAYMNSDSKGTTTAGKDEWTAWSVGAAYDLGAGVGLVAQYISSEWDDEGAVATDDGKTSAIIAGIEVGF